jgi:hypothetical protein
MPGQAREAAPASVCAAEGQVELPEPRPRSQPELLVPPARMRQMPAREMAAPELARRVTPPARMPLEAQPGKPTRAREIKPQSIKPVARARPAMAALDPPVVVAAAAAPRAPGRPAAASTETASGPGD